ncbi:hypothetical protein AB4Z32_27390, partial [Massilia sp. 2TAF26]|uniref:hypothetical protein n=1 Tax=Massilia sp. 2TAF26 TaxID=3233012 RepID=UPI003F943A75
GYSSLTTVDQFRDAVLDLTSSGALATEAGQKAYEGLLAIAPQFKQVADYLDQVKKSADDLAAQQAQQAVQLAQQLADAFSAAKSVAQNAFSALSSAVDRERAAIASRYSGIVGSLSTAIDGLGQSISRTKDIIALTKDAIQTFALPGQETQVGTDARRRLADIAHGSSLPDIDVIRQAIAGATQVNPEDFASQFDLVKATSQTRNDLLAIQDSAGRQLTGEEHSLAVVQQWKSEYETQQTAELDALNSQLERAQAQIDAINGVNTSVLTVRDALTAFASSISNAVSAQSAVGGGGAASGIASTSTTPAKAAIPDSFVTSFWENTALD